MACPYGSGFPFQSFCQAAKRISTAIPHATFNHQFPSFGGVADRPGWFLNSSAANVCTAYPIVRTAYPNERTAYPNVCTAYPNVCTAYLNVYTAYLNVYTADINVCSVDTINQTLPIINAYHLSQECSKIGNSSRTGVLFVAVANVTLKMGL